ncbi:N-succinylarginine dihydrolase, partial [Pseudomonas sp. MH10out]|uniref:N-succinylarginine dihydrolase n=1 Tax=Pseudomonas sp. MH10out TaxID=3048628 RepID=UPI002B232CDA
KHYRERVSEIELPVPSLLVDCRAALDVLSQLLKVGSVYPFQLYCLSIVLQSSDS